MKDNKFLKIGLEVLMMVSVLLVGRMVLEGDPSEANFASDIIMPYSVIYIVLYALKVFLLRTQSNLKYLFYLAFAVLILGLRFYEKLDITNSITMISLVCIGVLFLYHTISLLKKV